MFKIKNWSNSKKMFIFVNKKRTEQNQKIQKHEKPTRNQKTQRISEKP
jgi:hypothetical protein